MRRSHRSMAPERKTVARCDPSGNATVSGGWARRAGSDRARGSPGSVEIRAPTGASGAAFMRAARTPSSRLRSGADPLTTEASDAISRAWARVALRSDDAGEEQRDDRQHAQRRGDRDGDREAGPLIAPLDLARGGDEVPAGAASAVAGARPGRSATARRPRSPAPRSTPPRLPSTAGTVVQLGVPVQPREVGAHRRKHLGRDRRDIAIPLHPLIRVHFGVQPIRRVQFPRDADYPLMRLALVDSTSFRHSPEARKSSLNTHTKAAGPANGLLDRTESATGSFLHHLLTDQTDTVSLDAVQSRVSAFTSCLLPRVHRKFSRIRAIIGGCVGFGRRRPILSAQRGPRLKIHALRVDGLPATSALEANRRVMGERAAIACDSLSVSTKLRGRAALRLQLQPQRSVGIRLERERRTMLASAGALLQTVAASLIGDGQPQRAAPARCLVEPDGVQRSRRKGSR